MFCNDNMKVFSDLPEYMGENDQVPITPPQTPITPPQTPTSSKTTTANLDVPAIVVTNVEETNTERCDKAYSSTAASKTKTKYGVVDSRKEDTVYFSETSANNRELRNSHVCEFVVDAVRYCHVSGYYSAGKYEGYDNATAKRIISNQSARIVSKICNEVPVSEHRAKQWKEGRGMATLRRALYVKFFTDSRMLKELVSIGKKKIVYVNEVDTYLGVNSQGEGSNILGKLLFEIKDVLIHVTCEPDSMYDDSDEDSGEDSDEDSDN